MKPNTEAMQESIHAIHFAWNLKDIDRLAREALWMSDQCHQLLQLCAEMRREKREETE